MKKHKISVIIPAYNEEKCIARCISSIKKQTYPAYEIIVVCDGCTDNTYKISRKMRSKPFNIKHLGVSKARNYGAKKAKGNVLVFLDADSVMAKNLLFEVNKTINQGYVGGTCKTKALEPILRGKLAWAFSNFVRNFFFMASGMLFCKKEVFSGYPAANIAEDTHLIRALKKKGRLKYIKNSYIRTSLRRFEKQGYIRTALKQTIAYLTKKNYEYKAIR